MAPRGAPTSPFLGPRNGIPQISLFFPCEDFPCFFFVRFPFFSQGPRGSVGIANPCFFQVFRCVLLEKGKEGQGCAFKNGTLAAQLDPIGEIPSVETMLIRATLTTPPRQKMTQFSPRGG